MKTACQRSSSTVAAVARDEFGDVSPGEVASGDFDAQPHTANAVRSIARPRRRKTTAECNGGGDGMTFRFDLRSCPKTSPRLLGKGAGVSAWVVHTDSARRHLAVSPHPVLSRRETGRKFGAVRTTSQSVASLPRRLAREKPSAAHRGSIRPGSREASSVAGSEYLHTRGRSGEPRSRRGGGFVQDSGARLHSWPEHAAGKRLAWFRLAGGGQGGPSRPIVAVAPVVPPARQRVVSTTPRGGFQTPVLQAAPP